MAEVPREILVACGVRAAEDEADAEGSRAASARPRTRPTLKSRGGSELLVRVIFYARGFGGSHAAAAGSGCMALLDQQCVWARRRLDRAFCAGIPICSP